MSGLEVPDLHRMFIGDLPWSFTVEVVFRTALMYAWSILLVRVLSHRSVGQLSLVEFLLVIALGSAVGDPMFYADVPLLPAMLVVAVIVVMSRGYAELMNRSERFETFVEGTPHRMVRDGVIEVDELARASIAREELFERLRLRGIEHLGQVRAAYLEQNGQFSVFAFERGAELRGMAIEPPFDIHSRHPIEEGMAAPRSSPYACDRCGRVRDVRANESLRRCECGGRHWIDDVATSVA